MNMHTFKDAVSASRHTMADQLFDDDDDEVEKVATTKDIDGEEGDEEDNGKFNDVGEMITPFNMKDERESGFIDEDMNFVYKKDQEEVDSWVASLDDGSSEKNITEAAIAEKRRQAKLQEQEYKQSELNRLSKLELVRALLDIMQPNESVKRTLLRLSGRQAQPEKDIIRRRRSNDFDPNDKPHVDNSTKNSIVTAKSNRVFIDRVTELADRLIASGMTDIYSATFEALQSFAIRWEYKGADGRIYGPFTTRQIVDWRSQGFLTGETAVSIRQVDSSTNALLREKRKRPADSSGDDQNEKKRVRYSDDAASHAGDSLNEVSSGAVVDDSATEKEWFGSDSIDFRAYLRLESEIVTEVEDT